MVPKHLFGEWTSASRRLSRAKKIHFMSDFDGTLVPIAPHPKMPRLDKKGRLLLNALAKKPNFTVSIVSGRSISELESLVKLSRVYYLGNHGLEVKGLGTYYVHRGALQNVGAIQTAYLQLRRSLDKVKGVIIENKVLTMSVHYRLVEPSLRVEVKRVVRKIVAEDKRLILAGGKMVVELRPRVRWNKGKAVSWLLEKIGKDGEVLYVGDDLTDEDAFSNLSRHITILVSSEPKDTKAKYYLRNVSEVADLLRRLDP